MSEPTKPVNKKIQVKVERLVKGLYIDLEVSWLHHPFLFRRFKITTDEELEIIRGLGLEKVTVFLEKSEVEPPPDESAEASEQPAAEPNATASKEEMWLKKQGHMEDAAQFRSRRAKVAARYKETVKKVKNFTSNLRTAPANAIRDAREIVEDMAAAFEAEGDVLMNLINLSDSGFSLYNHSLNVTVLSMQLGSAVGMKGEELRDLGLGAVLHDIGKTEVPAKILLKKEKLTNSEEAILRSHTILGSRLAQRVQLLPKETVDIIERHHEMMDGSGYPKGLKDYDLSKGARITAIANLYDNLCNPHEVTDAMTPKVALAVIYSKYKGRLDGELVELFIRKMGVYPPGSVVQLSDESIGLVVAVDPKALLQPTILLYNPDIPRSEALHVDLQKHPNLSIEKVLKPGEYPTRIYEYLGIKDRIGYFFEQRNKTKP